MHSHHSHSGQFCAHAKGNLEAVAMEAIRQRFTIYGLSEHVPRYRVKDLYPEEKSLGLSHLFTAFEDYVREAHRLKDLLANRITLLVGLETELVASLDLPGLRTLLEKHEGNIDYIVGSVHHVNEWPIDFDEATWKKAVLSFDIEDPSHIHIADHVSGFSRHQLTPYLTEYFEAQLEVMQEFHPEVIGHFDLCRLYIPALRLDDPIYEGVWDLVQRNVDYAIQYGACFELSAAAFRKGWNTGYPGREVLELIISKRGKLVLSDDSHGPHAVGLNYHLLFDYINLVGVRDLWYLERCRERNAGGRRTRAVKMPQDWRRSEWWSNRLHEMRVSA
ncbi:histidinolphosphatase [Tulasnella sp. JGI-2019a]|nr:histidinolphosphatase [Tulasnella sp. JGI-2019a]KAG9011418.1 histidinolphosphatase [Tulasnella sp. JGI-2019a]